MQSDREIICRTAEECSAAGRALGAALEPGSVVALNGPLGAGKTQFVKGLAEALGVTEEVSSPTFTLIHEYSGTRRRLCHFDFYRMETAEEAAALGLEDYFGKECCAVEWAEKFPGLLPANCIQVTIHPRADGSRAITIRPSA